MIPIRVVRVAPPSKTHLLQRLGDAMRRHAHLIWALQWMVVLFYLALVVLPVFLPLPPQGASILNNLTLFAQFLFWGIWWPFVILSVFLLGRVWCGVLCPEGALSELASKHGLGKAIPRWLRWRGWPFTACTFFQARNGKPPISPVFIAVRSFHPLLDSSHCSSVSWVSTASTIHSPPL